LNSSFVGLGGIIVVLLVYILIILWLRKQLLKNQVACLWRSLFLAAFLAPGLLIFGEHAGIPLPAFAWMSGAMNIYNCTQLSLFCSFKLNLYLSILPFFATWLFSYMMCKDSQKEQGHKSDD